VGPEALVERHDRGRSLFSIRAPGDRAGYEGYLEFNVQIR
jgi:hypothetical protein